MSELRLPYEMMKLNTAKLVVPKNYQRLLDTDRVARIAADFDEYTANEPKVSYRGDNYYVFDGNHTMNARKLLNGGKDLDIFCKVYFNLDEEKEARLFAKQTGDSKPLTPSIKLRANLFGNDSDSLAFIEATEKAGVQIGYDRAIGVNRLICISTAFAEFKRVGADIYTEAMTVINKAWDGAPEAFRAELVQGIVRFVELYHANYSKSRLIARLSDYEPKSIYISANSDTTLHGRKRFVRMIYRIYNGNRKTPALSVKF